LCSGTARRTLFSASLAVPRIRRSSRSPSSRSSGISPSWNTGRSGSTGRGTRSRRSCSSGSASTSPSRRFSSRHPPCPPRLSAPDAPDPLSLLPADLLRRPTLLLGRRRRRLVGHLAEDRDPLRHRRVRGEEVREPAFLPIEGAAARIFDAEVRHALLDRRG